MNETFDVVFNQILNLLQGVFFVIYCNAFFTPKLKKRTNTFVSIFFIVLLYVAINIINLFFPVYSNFEILINFAIMIPFSVFFHKGNLYLKILIPILSFLIMMCMAMLYSTIISIIFGKDFEQIMIDSTVYRYLYMLIANATYVFVMYIIYRIYKDKINLKKPTDIIMFFAIPLLTLGINILATAVIYDAETSEWNRICVGIIALITFVIAFAMFSLMQRIGKSAEVNALNTVMKKEQEMYKSEIINQSRYIEDVSRVKHEMKNKLFCINEFLRSGRIAEAQKICEDAETELSEITTVFRTDNVYLDALLNMANQKAIDNNIEFRPTIKSNLMDISGTDLISLLGNLLDNALEALQKSNSDKHLQITIFEKDKYYMFSVKNSIEESVISTNPELETTKQEKKLHGHGLKIVKEIVKKHNGTISFYEKNGTFDVMCMLERNSVSQ